MNINRTYWDYFYAFGERWVATIQMAGPITEIEVNLWDENIYIRTYNIHVHSPGHAGGHAEI